MTKVVAGKTLWITKNFSPASQMTTPCTVPLILRRLFNFCAQSVQAVTSWIVPEFKDIEVDGALVKVKGLAVKIGETATMETNMVELSADWIKTAIVGQDGTSTIEGYDVIESKRQLEEGDYITNFGYIGKKMDGTPIIIIFDYALCTSGFSAEGKNKENGVFPATFECYAELSPEADILPYHIYTPSATV